ncbi:MAG TPA: glucose-1-phosphate cytidylyltransferase [Egibacteraceae bacterium]|nr:glucose-1-phosphate cytidylyltransferase [Egibacteraceae bacterium]
MKVVILAGGRGTRIAEETVIRPKPMVEIGGKPILWHLLKYYGAWGHREFVIALGYKGEEIKRYMVDYVPLGADLTVRLRTGEVAIHDGLRDDWVVELVDTGQSAQTGARIKRLADRLGGQRFMMTWGDGLANVDLDALLAFHQAHGRLCTLTAVRPPARFGHVELDGDRVTVFDEKPQASEGWINGAFFVCEPGVLDYIDDEDDTAFERGPLDNLAKDGELMAFRHDDFWQCMDTVRDRDLLNDLWESGQAPWRIWE